MSSELSSCPPVVSRLRRGGLALAAAAALAASVPLTTANAQVVHNTTPIVAPAATISVTITTEVNVDNAGGNEFAIISTNPSKNGAGRTYSLNFNGEASAFRVVATSAGSKETANVGEGFSVNGGDDFSDPNGAFIYQGGQFAPGADQFFGFTFNPSGSLDLYGWGEFALASDLSTLTLVQYAYDISGAAIVTPSAQVTPEPGNIALLVGMATAGAGFLRRKRRRSVRP